MRSDMSRYVPLRYFTEILAFVILFCITARYPGLQKVSTLAWLGALVLLMALRRNELGYIVMRWWPLLLAPLLAVASFTWSDSASVSARYGAQLLVAAFAGMLLARAMPPSRLILVLFLSVLVICVLSILSGRTGLSEGGLVLIGLLGSKNQMSAMGYLLLFSGLAVLFEPRTGALFRLLSLPGMAIGGYVLMQTDSATGVVLSAAGVVLFVTLCVMQRLPPAGRVLTVVAALLITAPLLTIQEDVAHAVEQFMTNVLHKEPGLTGRDVLWARAMGYIEARPLLGYGYQAMWLGGTAESNSMLAQLGVTDGRTFNFHNTYLQFAVDTGLVGAGVFALTMVLGILAAARRYVIGPSVAHTFFFVFLLLTAARTITEVLLVSFGAATVLLYVCLTYAFWRPQPGWSDDPLPHPAQPTVYPLGPQPAWASPAPIAWPERASPAESPPLPARSPSPFS
jgi:exopolysaccharide production protein ExoQ